MANLKFHDINQIYKAIEKDGTDRDGEINSVGNARLQAANLRHLKSVSLVGKNTNQKITILGWRRNVKSRSRKIIKRCKAKLKIRANTSELLAIMGATKASESIFMNGLYPIRNSNWVMPSRRMNEGIRRRIHVKDFSFLHNPNRAIRSLVEIAEVESSCLSAHIDFDDDRCMDIGPWLALAVMRSEMSNIFTGGKISNAMSKIVDAVDLSKALGMGVNPDWSGQKDVWAMRYIQRRPAGTSTSLHRHTEPQTKEFAAGHVTEVLEEWLNESSKALTNDGERILLTMVGETLDNAERHARPDTPVSNDGDWLLSGFMALREGSNGTLKHHCHVAMMSVGMPIEETLEAAHPDVKKTMQNYVVKHSRSLGGLEYPVKHLRTITALQDKISCDPTTVTGRRGGTGLRDIIRVFTDLCDDEDPKLCQKMAIVSGRTCLHIPPELGNQTSVPADKKFNIWFNSTNDELTPPELKYLTELEADFRGTLVTMSFVLDPGYIDDVPNEHAND